MVRWALYTGDGYIETKIVFGTVSNSETVLSQYRQELDGQIEGLHTQLAILTKSTPGLRLSTPGWIDITPRNLTGIDSTELLFELCMEKLRTRIRPFSQRIRQFIESYFAFVAQQIEAQAVVLGTDEIIKPDDWLFSCWLPLPHAKILLPENDSGTKYQFVEIDILYWTGHSFVALQIEQTGFIPKSKRENLERLKVTYPNLKFITIDHKCWGLQSMSFPKHMFDHEFLEFWHDVTLPRGPALTSLSFGTDFQGVKVD